MQEARIEQTINNISLEDALKEVLIKADKNVIITKSNAIYEVIYNNMNILISNDLKYIDIIEPENISDWTYTKDGIITAYNGTKTDIIIPNYIDGTRIKEIRKNTFVNKVIDSVEISEGIEIIGDGVFANSNIKKVKIPDSTIKIDGGAFNCNYELTEVIFGNNIQKIGPYPFYGCNKLKGTLKCPDTLQYIGDAAFRGCVNMEGEYKTTPNLTYLGYHAFRDCKKITGSIAIPEQMTVVQSWTFAGCASLNGNILLHEGITEIESHAFAGCQNLSGTLILPSTLEKLGQNTFYQCKNLKGDLIIPDKITEIPYMSFDGCGFNGTLKIPSSVLTINNINFKNVNFKKVIIYNTETNIPRDLFSTTSTIEYMP